MAPPRLIFMVQPKSEVRSAMRTVVTENALAALLGDRMFPAQNWHQSLSNRRWEEPGLREKMLRAGVRVLAHTFTMTLDGFSSGKLRDHTRPIHWAFEAKHPPKGFADLLAAVKSALSAEGLVEKTSHTAHVTVSYRAPHQLAAVAMNPIHWTIDTLQLVLGGGSPYHYEVLGQWPLMPPVATTPQVSTSRKSQLNLFE